MDNRMIDVAIGLALVFALSSLLTTAVQEVWAQWKGKRGQFLHKALVSFAGDDEKFAKALMAHPLLVSLSQEKVDQHDQRRPSYIEADSIVAALLGQLVQTHASGVRPSSPVALVDAVHQVATGQLSLKAVGGAVAAQAALPNEALAQALNALVQGVEQDWPGFEARVAAWWNAVNERATGWFKRDTQTTIFGFGLAAAAVLNINPIVIGDRLWEDKVLRAEVVRVAQREVQAYDAANAPKGTAPAPNQNPAPPPAPVPTRAAAPTAAPALAAAKATPAVVMPHIDAIAEALAAAYRASNGRATAALDRATARLLDLAQRAQAAPAAADLRPRAQALLDGLSTATEWPAVHGAHQQLMAALAPPPTAPAAPTAPPVKPAADAKPPAAEKLCTSEQEASLRELCQRLKPLEELQQAGLPIGWTATAWPRVFDQGCNAKSKTACDARPHPLLAAWWGNLLIAVAGWVLTGLACTLGAPFWFDALSKLVRLRASGGRPESGAGATAAGAAASSQLARSPKPATEAPAGPPAVGVMSDALNDAERALTPLQVQQLQRALTMAEADVSGWLDGKTRLSIQDWHARRGQNPPSGELGADDINELLRQVQGDQGDGYIG